MSLCVWCPVSRTLSQSYIAHYNAPQFLAELKNNTMARFNQVVSGAFLSSIVFFVFIMSVGFSTFGGATAGFVLNNYASSDLLATLARFAIGLALLTGYPFTFSALREGILDLRKVEPPLATPPPYSSMPSYMQHFLFCTFACLAVWAGPGGCRGADHDRSALSGDSAGLGAQGCGLCSEH